MHQKRRFGGRLHMHAEPLPPFNPALNQNLPLSPLPKHMWLEEPTSPTTPLATPTPRTAQSAYPQALDSKPTSLSAPLPSISIDMSRSRSPSSFRRFMRTPEPQKRNCSDDSDGTESSSHGSTSGTESLSVGMQRDGPGSHSTGGFRSRIRPYLGRKHSLDMSILQRSASSSSLTGSPLSQDSHTLTSHTSRSSLTSEESSSEETEKLKPGDVETPATTPEPEPELQDSIIVETKPVKGKRAVRKDTVEPILQAHSAMAVWNDFQTTELLHRLSSGAPTFVPFGKPPRRVLDLGCGDGAWVKYAATKWNTSETRIIGFDIEPLWEDSHRPLEPGDVPTRFDFTVGNFLDPLPFRDDTFDLVRVANLGLCVPKERWPPLLMEVKRILRLGGRVEIIDDEVFFPRLRIASTWHGQSSISDTSMDSGTRSSKFWEQEDNKRTSKYLEDAFGTMISKNYGITKVHADIKKLLPQVFGEDRVRKYGSYRVAVPLRSPLGGGTSISASSRTSEASGSAPRKISLPGSFTGSFTPKVQTPLVEEPEPIFPSSASQKAMQVLHTGRPSRKTSNAPSSASGHLPDFTPAKAAKLLATATASRAYQPQGFLVLPDKFYDCRPDALEMHACKNMHIVLACKRILAAWLKEHKDELTELGGDLTDKEFEHIFEDAMWQYDRFKRRRLNWPTDYPGLLMDDDEPEVSSSSISGRGLSSLVERRRRAQSTTNCTIVPPVAREDCTQVRAIRVFGAMKA